MVRLCNRLRTSWTVVYSQQITSILTNVSCTCFSCHHTRTLRTTCWLGFKLSLLLFLFNSTGGSWAVSITSTQLFFRPFSPRAQLCLLSGKIGTNQINNQDTFFSPSFLSLAPLRHFLLLPFFLFFFTLKNNFLSVTVMRKTYVKCIM